MRMPPIFQANGVDYTQSSPRYLHEPIPLENVGSGSQFRKRGDFCWHIEGEKRIFVVAIPCRNPCGWLHSEWTIDHLNECGSRWAWDGNEDMPTLKPSLHAVGIWHGSVVEGELIEASGL